MQKSAAATATCNLLFLELTSNANRVIMCAKRLFVTGISGFAGFVCYGAYSYAPNQSQQLNEEMHFVPLRDIPRMVNIGVTTSLCRLYARVLNNIEVDEFPEKAHRFILDRPKGVGLLTVCNHTSVVDDPWLVGSIMPWTTLFNLPQMRWGLCADSICFSNALKSSFCGSGKVLPVERGAGFNQWTWRSTSNKLNRGDWVHIFPEGRVYQQNAFDVKKGWSQPSGRRAPKGRELGPLKWGVGKLIADTKVMPIVLPFFHWGMENIVPHDSNNKVVSPIPALGQSLGVIVGEPMKFDDLLREHEEETEQIKLGNYSCLSRDTQTIYKVKLPQNNIKLLTVEEAIEHRKLVLYARITDRIEHALSDLEKKYQHRRKRLHR